MRLGQDVVNSVDELIEVGNNASLEFGAGHGRDLGIDGGERAGTGEVSELEDVLLLLELDGADCDGHGGGEESESHGAGCWAGCGTSLVGLI